MGIFCLAQTLIVHVRDKLFNIFLFGFKIYLFIFDVLNNKILLLLLIIQFSGVAEVQYFHFYRLSNDFLCSNSTALTLPSDFVHHFTAKFQTHRNLSRCPTHSLPPTVYFIILHHGQTAIAFPCFAYVSVLLHDLLNSLKFVNLSQLSKLTKLILCNYNHFFFLNRKNCIVT